MYAARSAPLRGALLLCFITRKEKGAPTAQNVNLRVSARRPLFWGTLVPPTEKTGLYGIRQGQVNALRAPLSNAI